MFILRRIVDEQGSERQECNLEIGTNYNFITKGRNKKQFDEFFQFYSFSKESYDKIYGFVSSGGEDHALYVDHHNYIMTSTGQTFSHL